jgi:hypothetical protein
MLRKEDSSKPQIWLRILAFKDLIFASISSAIKILAAIVIIPLINVIFYTIYFLVYLKTPSVAQTI